MNGSNATRTAQTQQPSLRQLDSMWREREPSNPFEHSRERKETEQDFLLRKNIDLGQQFRESGIVHRLPRWDFFVADSQKKSDDYSTRPDPPKSRLSDLTCARYCTQLMDSLQGHARLFTKCEFFYSDLDRGW